jgi:hypothetical protein
MQSTSLALLGTAALPLVLGAYVGSLPEATPASALPAVTLAVISSRVIVAGGYSGGVVACVIACCSILCSAGQ